MAEVGIGVFTPHLDALHEKAPVFFFHNVFWFKGLCKTWPSGSRFEFVQRNEQGFAGYNVHINALLMVIPVLILERSFGSVFLSHLILQRGQSFLQSCVI